MHKAVSQTNLSQRASVHEEYFPIPIGQKEQIMKTEVSQGEVKLVQQYVMVQGRLQPALRYIAPNPMFNRYKV